MLCNANFILMRKFLKYKDSATDDEIALKIDSLIENNKDDNNFCRIF